MESENENDLGINGEDEKSLSNFMLQKMGRFLLFNNYRENEQFTKNPELLKAAARNNCTSGIGVFYLVLLIGVLGTIGEFLPFVTPEVFPQINGTLVYIMMIVLNAGFILIFQDMNKKVDLMDPVLVLNVAYICFSVDALLAGLTIFSTQQGSSTFFELTLIMTILCYLPFYRKARGWFIPFISLVVPVLTVNITDSDIPAAWQDQFDIVIFYILCEIYIYIKRNWFITSVRLQLDLKEANRKLAVKSRTDGLTGLMNRTALEEDKVFFLHHHLCIAMIDFDSFKKANDTLGHTYGDKILKDFSALLQKQEYFKRCFCYRYGGDEFIIIAKEADLSEFAKEITDFQNLFNSSAEELPVAVSIGYSYGIVSTAYQFECCIRTADSQLYESKYDGYGRPCGKPFTSDTVKTEEKTLSGDYDYEMKDMATGLLNRKGFYKCVSKELKNNTNWTIVFLDIDRFQDLNKRFGYKTGNTVIRKVSSALSSSFQDAVITHTNSDHFAMMIPSTDRENILRRISKAQQLFSTMVPHWHLVVRAGVKFNDVEDDPLSIRTAIDMAKYACDSLRHQSNFLIKIYDNDLEQQRIYESYVINNLDDALRKGHIQPYYQKVVNASDGSVAGYEALSRWITEDGSIISPARFIPVLESNNDIYKVDFYILRQVCSAFSKMPEEFKNSHFVSVNFSRIDFDVVDMVKSLSSTVEEYDIPKGSIIFEITESAMADSTKIRKSVTHLRAMGYHVWLDDFGSGNSSMNLLKDYQVDGTKLDMGFIKDLDSNPKARIIINELIRLSHALDMEVIMEGVETEEQNQFIRDCGAEFIQGFYYGKPLPLEKTLNPELFQ